MATLARWRDVLLYALVGAGVVRALLPRVERYLANLLPSNDTAAAVALWLFAVLSIWALHQLAGARLAHIRHFFRYPPLPVAALLGILLLQAWDSAISPQGNWTAVAAVGCLYGAVWLAHCLLRAVWSRSGRQLIARQVNDRAVPDPAASEEELLAWIQRESPITDSASDRFGHQAIAERLLRRLSQSETSIALQGGFGSGKSSIGQLAASLSEARRLPLVFANVSCWGFSESLDAQEELLMQVIRRVSNHVDTFGLRSVPAEYVGAMGSHMGWYGAALRIMNGKRSPDRVLQRLSSILSIIRKRIVLFVEDADRNFATFDMTQLESLLIRLREIPGLSFVLCVSPTQKIDVSRLCERTELVPELPQDQTLRLFERTRDLLLRRYPVRIMLDRVEGLTVGERDLAMLEGALGYYWPRQYIIRALAATPRTLKRILRRVVEAWPDLCGEVTIDDLINISVLREGAPEAFAFFQRNHRFFKAAVMEHNVTEAAKTKVKETLSEEWQQIATRREFDARSAAWLMKEIFPSSAGITGLFATHTIRRQSMESERRGAIYARRLIGESALGDEVTDQRIFELLRNAQSDDRSLGELAATITDSTFASDAFEEFAGALQFDRFLPLLSQVYRIIRERHGARLSREDHPGFFAPWRLIMYNRPEGFDRWLTGELCLCIPKNLRLMNDIYYFFVGADRHTFAEREPSRRAIHSALKEAWTTIPPSRISDGFDGSFPYTLFHLIFTSDYEKPETVPLGTIEEWAWSGPPLAAAAQAAPSVMLPQIINALNLDSSRGREVPRFTLDEARFHTWFANDRSIIIDLIRRGFEVPPELDPQSRYLIAQAIEHIKTMHGGQLSERQRGQDAGTLLPSAKTRSNE